jgi:hypothetical protein
MTVTAYGVPAPRLGEVFVAEEADLAVADAVTLPSLEPPQPPSVSVKSVRASNPAYKRRVAAIEIIMLFSIRARVRLEDFAKCDGPAGSVVLNHPQAF